MYVLVRCVFSRNNVDNKAKMERPQECRVDLSSSTAGGHLCGFNSTHLAKMLLMLFSGAFQQFGQAHASVLQDDTDVCRPSDDKFKL